MKQRQLAISTPLGEEKLVLNRMVLRERLNAPFEIEAELCALDGNVNYNQIVGHAAAITLDLGKHGKRYFNGLVSRMTQTGNRGGFARYRALIVPWLWFLTRTSDCRTFQHLTALDIAEQVFQKARFGSENYQLRTSAAYPKRRYCVQYRETDYNFVNRLFESEGVAYWFEHTASKHQLILADRIGASKTRPGYESIDYHEVEGAQAEGREVVTDWVVEQEVQTVHYELKDFDFKKPSDPLKTSHEVTRQHGMARFAAFDFPGEYFDSGDGTRYAELRLEELQAQYLRVHGTTTARGLAAGQVFELKKHPHADQNRKYLITELTLTAESGEFASGGADGEFFQCHFTAIPSDVPFRPPRVTPKPVIQGIQSATVVGPPGEEIHTDKYGRVKVQFHWDRYGKSNDESSCWVRVSQLWAGKNWGAIHIPRIGQEVTVEFLEGDPDRPLVMGRVYNAEQTVPYALPANKTESGIKSRSSKGGGPANFNEIRFEDKKGQEQVYIHAEKNQDNVVENDETTQVGRDRTENVGRDEKITIGHDRTEKVGHNETITIGHDRSEQVGHDESIMVAHNRTRLVGSNETVTVALMRTHSVGVNEAITVGATQEVTIGAMQVNSIGANRTTNVGANDSLSVGKKLSIDAGDEISIKTGSSSITMKKDGTILIQGKDITIKGSGNIVVKGTKVAIN